VPHLTTIVLFTQTMKIWWFIWFSRRSFLQSKGHSLQPVSHGWGNRFMTTWIRCMTPPIPLYCESPAIMICFSTLSIHDFDPAINTDLVSFFIESELCYIVPILKLSILHLLIRSSAISPSRFFKHPLCSSRIQASRENKHHCWSVSSSLTGHLYEDRNAVVRWGWWDKEHPHCNCTIYLWSKSMVKILDHKLAENVQNYFTLEIKYGGLHWGFSNCSISPIEAAINTGSRTCLAHFLQQCHYILLPAQFLPLLQWRIFWSGILGSSFALKQMKMIEKHGVSYCGKIIGTMRFWENKRKVIYE